MLIAGFCDLWTMFSPRVSKVFTNGKSQKCMDNVILLEHNHLTRIYKKWCCGQVKQTFTDDRPQGFMIHAALLKLI